MNQNEIDLDGIRFVSYENSSIDRKGFLFDPGRIFVCEGILQKYSDEWIGERLMAHARREVAEFNIIRMNAEEKSFIENFLSDLHRNSSIFVSETKLTLERILPIDLYDWLTLEMDKEIPDPVSIRRELFRNMEPDQLEPAFELVMKYIGEVNQARTSFDPWSDFISEDKTMETIENDETVDSFFGDGSVIMTTPERKATIIYLESRTSRIHSFYKLDRMV